MRRIVFTLALLLAFVGFSTPASTQTAPNDVYVGAPFQVAGTHNGSNATEWRLYRDGVLVATILKSAGFNTTTNSGFDAASSLVQFPARTESATGSRVYSVSSANSDGTTTLVSPTPWPTVTVNVIPALQAPANITLPRIIKVTP